MPERDGEAHGRDSLGIVRERMADDWMHGWAGDWNGRKVQDSASQDFVPKV